MQSEVWVMWKEATRAQFDLGLPFWH